MYRYRFIAQTIAGIWLVCASAVIATALPSILYHAQTTQAQLARTLTAAGCNRACVLGIEPSVALPHELLSRFEYANIPTEYVSLEGATMTGQPGRYAHYIMGGGRSEVLFPHEFSSMGFMFQRTNVAQININDIKGLLAADAIAALGNPTWIVLQGTIIELRYDDLGIILKVPAGNPDLAVTHIQLISERTQRNLDWFGYTSNSLQPCQEPALLCELQLQLPAS